MLRWTQKSLPLGFVNDEWAMSAAQPVIIVPTPAWHEVMHRTNLGKRKSLYPSLMPKQLFQILMDERLGSSMHHSIRACERTLVSKHLHQQ